jgi:hypothetical protein
VLKSRTLLTTFRNSVDTSFSLEHCDTEIRCLLDVIGVAYCAYLPCSYTSHHYNGRNKGCHCKYHRFKDRSGPRKPPQLDYLDSAVRLTFYRKSSSQDYFSTTQVFHQSRAHATSLFPLQSSERFLSSAASKRRRNHSHS